GVSYDTHRWTRWNNPSVLRDELLEAIVLDGAADLITGDTSVISKRHIEAEKDRSRSVDRHGSSDFIQGDLIEEDLHIAERIDRDTHLADLAKGKGTVAVVSHQRGEIERGRQPRLSLFEEISKPLIRLPWRSEASEHPHGPKPATVHRRLHAARKRKPSRIPEIALIIDSGGVRGGKRRHFHIAQRGEALLSERHLRLRALIS